MKLRTIVDGMERHIAEIEATYGEAAHNLINLFDELAFVCHSNGEHSQAEKYYLRSLTTRESYFGVASENCIPVLHRLGVLHRVQGKYEFAEFFYNRALLLTKQHFGAESLDFATRSNYLAGLYLAWNKYKQSLAYVEQSISLYKTLLSEDHIYVGFCLIAKAINNFGEGNQDELKASLEQADRIIQPKLMAELTPSEASLPAIVASLSLMYCRQSRFDEAEILFRFALMQEAREIWPHHASVGNELEKLAQVYRAKGQEKTSKFLAKESLKIKAKSLGPEHPEYLRTLSMITDMDQAEIGTQFEKDRLFNLLKTEVNHIQ